MRYHIKKPSIVIHIYGENYSCNHPIFNLATLFRIGDKGILIIEQYFDHTNKTTYWSKIEDWVANAIYLHKDFNSLFEKYSGVKKDGLYPTITVRHAMHWLKMKPIPKKTWETAFDRVLI